MISTLFKIIPFQINRAICIALFTIIGTISGYILYQNSKINNLSEKIEVLQTENISYKLELDKAIAAISLQNESIAKFKISKEEYESTIIIKEREISSSNIQEQIRIANEISLDSSTSNQFNIISDILREFSNENF